jgi:dedicator of cytokinesis protein 3
MVAVSIKVFRGDITTVVKENVSLLQGASHTLRLGFPDVVFPGDSRNELYIKLWCGDFASTLSQGTRLSVVNLTRGQMGPSSSNVQVTVEVRDHLGQPVERVISQGSGEPLITRFHSMVFQRCNEPTFGELIKVQLPLDGKPNWHLFFTFRNRTTRERSASKTGLDNTDRPFAFSMQPLFPDQNAFVEDGSRVLVMYRADKLSNVPPELYLGAPSVLAPGQRPENIIISAEMARLAPPLRDTLTIRTSLCSTRFTQNPILLGLLNWRNVAVDTLPTILSKFTFVGEGEIVKFLQDIFDALFGILVSPNNSSGDLDPLVFNALVTVLRIVQDRRFSNFQPVLDVYIEKHFDCAPASFRMIKAMNNLIANPTSNETATPLREAFKVWHYVFKFITRSRELQKAKEAGMGGDATAEHFETKFKRDVRSHITDATQMMSITSPQSIVGTQAIALQHFSAILPELAKVFPTVELVTMVTAFANAVPVGKGKNLIWKLIMYLQVLKGFLFDIPQSRPLLVEAVIICIKPHFGRYDEFVHVQANASESDRDAARIGWLQSIRLCVTIVAVMLDKIQQNLVNPDIIGDRNAYRLERDNIEYLLSLLPRHATLIPPRYHVF